MNGELEPEGIAMVSEAGNHDRFKSSLYGCVIPHADVAGGNRRVAADWVRKAICIQLDRCFVK